MRDKAAILAKLQHILRDHVEYTGEVRGDMDLRADLGLDSLQQLTLVVEAENAFALCFEAEAEAELATVDDMIRYIQAHQAQDAPMPHAQTASRA